MNKFKIAHIKQQGQSVIIIPMESNFEYKTSDQQLRITNSLQFCATNAGLVGTVVPVWLHGRQMRFIAPRLWHPFLKSLSWNDVLKNINKELTLG
ncbi:hypothetical protein [Acinetobacter rudis]|uniref:Uncharacterized protein n=1 Tax=Acinetobacter rudis TaxID=632955 RepID=A0AAW8JC08_9GAMM|nr:hypothetical protein [Acinetobacter rudis]MDQ8936630.1 hypothetical protein [Acinetobacter rudis]MDQ9018884.1 hypothetical protein [Acinetobacter rudis]